MTTAIFILEIIGTIAFSLSGAVVAIKRGMDIFGVCILGVTTACGGGIMRDVLLGSTPPSAFVHPVYALVAIVTAVIVFLPRVRYLLSKHPRFYEYSTLLTDSLGLGIFTVIGVLTAYRNTDSFNLFFFLFLGVVTACGGGVLRDMMSKNVPYIFIKHFYATASLIGAGVATLLLYFGYEYLAIFVGAAVVITLRLLAAHFLWSLPKAHELTEEELHAHVGDHK